VAEVFLDNCSVEARIDGGKLSEADEVVVVGVSLLHHVRYVVIRGGVADGG
jgi:hypothetical protein